MRSFIGFVAKQRLFTEWCDTEGTNTDFPNQISAYNTVKGVNSAVTTSVGLRPY
jgi:hypothetical protein